jgi:hypothetical protein
MALSFTVKVNGAAELQRNLKLHPKILAKETKSAFKKIGRSDLSKFKKEQLRGGSLNVKSRGFLNSFKSKVTGTSANDIALHEYTGAKPFEVFQSGGTITPHKGKYLTVLAPGARGADGKRIVTQKQLRAMLDSGDASIIKLKTKLAIILNDHAKRNKDHVPKVIAWLVPEVHEKKRIDFFQNFESNEAAHERIWAKAAENVVNELAGER